MKEVENLEEPELVIVRRVRERRGVDAKGLERWKVDRMDVGSLAAPRAPDNVVRSIFADAEVNGVMNQGMKENRLLRTNTSSSASRQTSLTQSPRSRPKKYRICADSIKLSSDISVDSFGNCPPSSL